MGVPGSELPVRQTRREGPAMLLDRTLAAMLLRLDGDGDLRQQEGRGLAGFGAGASPVLARLK